MPTAHGELLYGVWKGFRELAALGIADRTPRMVACEPAVRAPLAAALERGEEVLEVPPEPTAAHSIGATRNTLRGRVTVRESDGLAVPFSEPALDEAQSRLAHRGHWQEASSAAGVASLRAAAEDGRLHEIEDGDRPIVCLGTSSGFKDGAIRSAPRVDPEWEAIEAALAADPDLGI